MFYSAIHGDVETLRDLLQADPQGVELRDDTEQTLVMLAAQNGRYHAVELLLDMGADVEAESMSGRTALMGAVEAGFINTARLLIQRGGDPGRRSNADWSALSLAASREDVEMVRMLIEETDNARESALDFESALMWAERSDRPDILTLIENARHAKAA
jgi:ankyrin repeat protein